jgi:GDP-L-fucose synthase
MNKKSKIYIAGHNGMVGSAIWHSLESKGYTGLIGRSSNELDLRNQRGVADFFKKEKPEYVFLAAAKVGGIIANNTDRAEFIYNNLSIQTNIIHQSYLHGVKKLLFLGSTCVYPKESLQPIKEEYLLNSSLEYTNEPYAIAKIAGLKMCESYNIQYGTNFLSVMPTNLYGPNDNFNLEKSHVLPALIRKIHLGKCLEGGDWSSIRKDFNNRPIECVDGNTTKESILTILKKHGVIVSQNNRIVVEIWGTGKPYREFLWSEEMVDASLFIMNNINFHDLSHWNAIDEEKTGHQEIINTHINIGTGKEISIKRLANIITKTIGFKGKLHFNTDKPDGTMHKLTDVSKLHKLGWHHSIDIEMGIQKYYDWYCTNQ